MKFQPYKISVKTQEMHDFLRDLTNLQRLSGVSRNDSLNEGLANALDSEEAK